MILPVILCNILAFNKKREVVWAVEKMHNLVAIDGYNHRISAKCLRKKPDLFKWHSRFLLNLSAHFNSHQIEPADFFLDSALVPVDKEIRQLLRDIPSRANPICSFI